MSRTVFVNGDYVAEENAKVSVFDRGFLFADAIYEVTTVIGGRLVDSPAHMARLQNSLKTLSIKMPMSEADFVAAQNKLIELNNIDEGAVYLQVSRGVADRDYAYPDVEPTVVMFTMAQKFSEAPMAEIGLKIATVPEIRWKRRDVKTVGLLPAAMGKNEALSKGCNDAWFVEDGYITEGSASNAYIVIDDKTIVTRQLGSELLPGVTRKTVLRFAQEAGFKVEERAFTPAEAYKAQEAFITSATTYVMPVVNIDGHDVGTGKPGPVAKELRAYYIREAKAAAI